MSELVSTAMADSIVHQQLANGAAFGAALCEHFGLPPGKVSSDIEIHTGADEVFGATLFLILTPEDLAAIAARMGK